MSPVEVKRLRWSEDQVEVLKQANAALRRVKMAKLTRRLMRFLKHCFFVNLPLTFLGVIARENEMGLDLLYGACKLWSPQAFCLRNA